MKATSLHTFPCQTINLFHIKNFYKHTNEIIPFISRTERDRLRGYFRLSSRAAKESKHPERSIDNETTSVTHKTIVEHSIDDEDEKLHNNHKSSNLRVKDEGKVKVNTISNGHKHPSLHKTKPKNTNNGAPRSASLKSTISTTGGLDISSYKLSNPQKKLTVDSLDNSNSNSNITASTYLNNGGSSIDCESALGNKLDIDRKWLGGSLRNKDVSFSDCSSFRRMDSSSTLERDLEIIDYLERERSMDIQDMMEREKHIGSSDIIRRSSFERRRLPDIDKIRRSPRPIYSYDKRPSLDTETCAEEDESVVEEAAEDEPIQCYRQQTPSMAKFYSRRMNRKTSHHSSASHRSKRDSSFCTFNDDDFLAGAFGELDPTQPLSKMSVIESRIRRTSGRTSSVCSSGRNSLRSRDFSVSPHAHPELDFRENFADL